jgi:DNA mismatch repair protein MutH
VSVGGRPLGCLGAAARRVWSARKASRARQGVSSVGIELEALLVHRSGWPINLASLASSVMTILQLVPVGGLDFDEGWSTSRTLGLAQCLTGLVHAKRP